MQKGVRRGCSSAAPQSTIAHDRRHFWLSHLGGGRSFACIQSGKARADAKHPTVHKTEQPLTVKNDLAPNVNGAEAEMYVLYVLYDSACTTKKVLPHIGHFLSSEINENITGLKT